MHASVFRHLDKVISLKLVYHCVIIITLYYIMLAFNDKKENVCFKFVKKACL